MFSSDLDQLAAVARESVLPALRIVSQTGLAVGSEMNRNVQVENVHVVVKNSPFTCTLGTYDANGGKENANACLIDLHKVNLFASLYYYNGSLDVHGDQKEVDFVKIAPLHYKITLSPRGDTATVECRLRVLTSQHEHSLFLIKFNGLEPISQLDFDPPLQVFSHPIRVISKPDQLNTSKRTTTTTTTRKSTTKKKNIQNTPKKKQPQTSSAKVTDLIDRISQQQKEQATLVEQLMEMHQNAAQQSTGQNIPSPDPTPLPQLMDVQQHATSSGGNTPSARPLPPPLPTNPSFSSSSSTTSTAITPAATASFLAGITTMHEKKKATEFEEAFSDFLESYCLLAQDERPDKIRAVVEKCDPKEIDVLSEYLNIMTNEATQQQKQGYGAMMSAASMNFLQTTPAMGDSHGMMSSTTTSYASDQCACGAYCPHLKELERVDNAYVHSFDLIFK